jgi:hypothetical protein
VKRALAIAQVSEIVLLSIPKSVRARVAISVAGEKIDLVLFVCRTSTDSKKIDPFHDAHFWKKMVPQWFESINHPVGPEVLRLLGVFGFSNQPRSDVLASIVS